MSSTLNSCRDGDNDSYYWIVPVVFLAVLALCYRLSYPLLNESDVPWHMMIGKLLLETHRLPKTDQWAYGNQSQPWYILSWLWDLSLGVVLRFFGELGVFIYAISVGAALTAGICWRLMKLDIALPAVLLTTLLFALGMLDYINARPQMAGYVLAFVFHGLLHKSRKDAGYRHLRWLAPLMLIWVNAHGSFMAGYIIMGAYAVEAWFTRRFDWLKRIILTGIACAACTFINPSGSDVARGVVSTLGGATTRYNMEWQPFTFGSSTGLSVWLVMVLLASNLRAAAVPLADKVLALGWFLATMVATRNGAFFLITGAPYLAACFDVQTRGLRKPQPVSPLALFMQKQPIGRVWIVAGAIFCVMCAAASALPHDDQIQTKDYSISDAIDYALAHDGDHRFYLDYNIGSQVIYRAQGKLPFFIDSRAGTAYSDTDMQDYLIFLKLDKGWQDILARRHLNGIIAAKNNPFAAAYARGLYHDHWKLVFEGKRANVYIARP